MDELVSKHTREEYTNWSDVESIEQILAEILLRLPVRTIGICKSVSKRWCGLICSPHFINLQRSWSRRNLKYILYLYAEDSDVVQDVWVMEVDGETGQIMSLLGFKDLYSPIMVSSFNGLICCTDSSSSTMIDLGIGICNPATREILELPKGSPSTMIPSMGVIFDPKTNIYKIFRFFCDTLESKDDNYECEIYSSNTGLWRRIGRVPRCPMFICDCQMISNHVCVSGILYWFISLDEDPVVPGSILAVNMDENFRTISLPGELTEWSFLVDLKGRLSVVSVDSNYIMDVWVLQDCDRSIWYWKASAKIDMEYIDSLDSVAACNNGILFIIKDDVFLSHYHLFNLVDKTWRVLDLADTFEGYSPVAFPYSQSLISCGGI